MMTTLRNLAALVACSLSSMAWAQAAPGANTPEPLESPALWFSPDTYPPDAKRAGEEGAVGFTVDVDAQGQVASCRITQSSGSSALDEQTCALVVSRGKFTPAHDAAGKAVSGVWTNTIQWKLNGGSMLDLAADPLTLVSKIRLTIDEDGKAVDCTTVASQGPMGDGCGAFFPGRPIMPPLRQNGVPVRATLTMTTTSTVEPLPPQK